jgi:hypothetical protein
VRSLRAMAVSGPGELEVASLRRRGAAVLIDTVVLLPPIVAVGGGGVALYRRYRRGLGLDVGSWESFTTSLRGQTAMRIVSVAAAVPTRNLRTPGYRALGLRRVDAHPGGAAEPTHGDRSFPCHGGIRPSGAGAGAAVAASPPQAPRGRGGGPQGVSTRASR